MPQCRDLHRQKRDLRRRRSNRETTNGWREPAKPLISGFRRFFTNHRHGAFPVIPLGGFALASYIFMDDGISRLHTGDHCGCSDGRGCIRRPRQGYGKDHRDSHRTDGRECAHCRRFRPPHFLSAARSRKSDARRCGRTERLDCAGVQEKYHRRFLSRLRRARCSVRCVDRTYCGRDLCRERRLQGIRPQRREAAHRHGFRRRAGRLRRDEEAPGICAAARNGWRREQFQ